ncbi:MAG: DUF481 domain-containing protein [Ferruginibacter sp.]
MFFFITAAAFAQRDSLVLKNGNIIVGEIKSMNRGVIIVETDYSKDDFNIEWSGLKEIYSKSRFLITLKNGERINATFRSIDSLNRIFIEVGNGQLQLSTLDDIVYLKGLKSDFWSRVYANVDLGLSVAKANNIRQLNVSSNLGFYADKWKLDMHYSSNRAQQDNVAQTKRTESGIAFNYYLSKDWFLNTSVNTLSNTEQALDLRFSGKLGFGKYLVHTNKAYLGVGGGLSANRETFTNNTESRSSLEVYAGGEANFFDIGDFSFLSNWFVYYGITETGRWRSDFKFDTKYKLPHDLFLKLGITLNYDNRPAIAGNETDYVYGFSIGWKL